MVKDIVVNLSVREDGGNVGDYAVSVADALGAHIVGIAFLYDPIVPISGTGYIPAEIIDTQVADNQDAAKAAIDRFNAATARTGVSAETVTLSASAAGAGDQFARIARRFDLAIVPQAEPKGGSVEELIAETTLFESGRPMSILPAVMRLTSTLSPWRARCLPMSAPSISSCLPGSLATITTSTRPAFARSGMASLIARAACRPPSQHTMTRSSLSGLFWI